MTREVWLNSFGVIATAEFNPCGCCPGDLVLTWGKRFNQAASYSFYSEQLAREWLLKQGYEKLGEL
jgi:hypothetical protein